MSRDIIKEYIGYVEVSEDTNADCRQ